MSSKTFEEAFGSAPQFVAAAPGRLEFIGNHVDYNGGQVMGVAIDRRVQAQVALRSDRKISLYSNTLESSVEVVMDELAALSEPDGWANYALGVFWALQQKGLSAEFGFNLRVDSDLPFGAGVSSSAAFELATAYALAALYEFEADKKTMAQIARFAENEFVGLPCGILDQGVSAFGQADHLVLIDCWEEHFETIAMPRGVHFWVFNSQKKHALIDSMYSTRFQECQDVLAAFQKKWPGISHLAAASPEQLESLKADLPDNLYRRAHHVIEENLRVQKVKGALAEQNLEWVGELLFESHESSRHWFENSCEELDTIVDLLKGAPGVYGARLTGGGFGGAVMAVTNASFDEVQATRLMGEYEKRFGGAPTLFHAQAGEGAGQVPTSV